MGEMDAARSRGDYRDAAHCAARAAAFEEQALAALSAAHPERVRTISIIATSAKSLRACADKYATLDLHKAR